MKLLFDANLSFRLVAMLADLFPGSKHVKELGLEAAGDEVIWSFALKNGFIIVSKDSDFRHWSFTFGAPPKVISIQRGNCSTEQIESVLRAAMDSIRNFERSDTESIMFLE